MNIEDVREVLEENFASVKLSGRDIFRATKELNNHVHQVHYVDLSQSIFSSDFDLEKYQRELIVSDFYLQQGSLQWNFYLHFLIDRKNIKKENYHIIKYRIEIDKRLARKSVFTLDEFVKYLNPIKASGLKKPVNIVDRWEQALDEELLDVLDESIAMKSIVSSFLTGEKKRKAPSYNNGVRTEKFPQISKLVLQKYRPFPVTRVFNFGMVNLISGPNAVGKTSLLEAIEVTICGKTIRNPDAVKDFQFSLTSFDDPKPATIKPENDAFYRSRDQAWYGRNYSRGNELHNSFARFNYFDSDAAVRFSERIDENGGISKTLTQVVFGPHTDHIFERIEKINGLFIAEEKSLRKQLESDKSSAAIAKKEIIAKTKADAEAISQNAIKKRLNSYGVKLKDYDAASLEHFTKLIGRASVALAEWRSAREQFDITTYQSFDKVKHILEQAEKKIFQIESAESKINKNKKAALDQLQSIEIQSKDLDRLQAYQRSGALSLAQLETQYKLGNGQFQTLKKATQLWLKVNEKKLDSYKELTIGGAKQKIQATFSSLRRQESENLHNLQEARGNLDQTSLLIKELRSKGEQLVQTNPSISFCPLCSTDLTPENLSSRLEKPIKSLDSFRTNVDALLKVSNKIAKQRSDTENLLKTLDLLDSVIELIPDKLNRQMLISGIISLLGKVGIAADEVGRQVDQLKVKIDQLKEEGYSIAEANRLTAKLNLKIDADDLAEKINERVPKIANQKKTVLKTIEAYDTSLEGLSKEASLILKTNKALRDLNSQAIIKLIGDFSDIRSEVEKLSSIFPLSPSDTHKSVDMKITQVKELVGYYLRAIAEEKSLRDLKSVLAKLEINIKENTRKLKRSKNAISQLTWIIESVNPEDLIEDFLKEYTSLISEIFNQIHSPREFDGVELSKGELFARRTHRGEVASLNQLSAGQRTAFVLSVFLAMNKVMKDGPRLLVFDDPVTYVDDLNVLSFIDYLQKLSANENQQVFFATANQRIASLFSKKFDYLKDLDNGFKEIRLTRIDSASVKTKAV